MKRTAVAGAVLLWTTAVGAAPPTAVARFRLPVAVRTTAGQFTPDGAVNRWRRLAAQRSLDLVIRRAGDPAHARGEALTIASLRTMAGAIPALQVLRLPFFYPDQAAVHRALDGPLGNKLKTTSEKAGWHLLAVWDNGMTAMSGNEPYNVLSNLAGIRFAMLQRDRLTRLELNALGSWTRIIGPGGVDRMGRQCVVSSRSATPREILREKLYRVQLDMTLTNDRYRGWVVAMPDKAWRRLPASERRALTTTLAPVTRWQRIHAARLQRAAVRRLQHAGLAVHAMTNAQRRSFRDRLSRWQVFLPASLRTDGEARALIRAAATAAAAPGVVPHADALSDAQPATPASQHGQ